MTCVFFVLTNGVGRRYFASLLRLVDQALYHHPTATWGPPPELPAVGYRMPLTEDPPGRHSLALPALDPGQAYCLYVVRAGIPAWLNSYHIVADGPEPALARVVGEEETCPAPWLERRPGRPIDLE